MGGIEAEAVMLGQPISMVLPQVIGYRLMGNPHPLVTSTDIVLTITKVTDATSSVVLESHSDKRGKYMMGPSWPPCVLEMLGKRMLMILKCNGWDKG